MNTEYALEQHLDQVTEGFRQADMARKYKEITEAQGPSQQLIDFINADGKLGEEIGLEGFESFSTNTQHEILLSKLNPDTMEAVAMEGFGDFVKKYRGWLTGAGVVGLLLPGSIGLITVSLLAAGASGIVMKYMDSLVTTKAAFEAWAKHIDSGIDGCEKIVKGVPSGTDEASWAKYRNLAENVNEAFDKYIPETEEVAKLAKSGWDSTRLVTHAKWLDDTIHKFEELRKSYNTKISKYESMGDKTPKDAVKVISSAARLFKQVDSELISIHNTLKKVSKGFEIEKKD